MPMKLSYDKELKVITNIPGWAEIANSGGNKKGGSAVTAYLSSAWAFRAISIRADAIASAPLILKDGEDEEIEDHLVLDLLNTVNSEWNKGDLWRYTESAFCVYGCAYWQKIKAGDNVVELMFINPKDMTVNYSSGGITSFTQRIGKGTKTYQRDEIIYFRGSYDPGSDLSGIAPLSMSSLAALGELKADQYMAAFFANYAVPPLLLTTDQAMTDNLVERVTAFWNKTFKGPGNQHKVGIVGSGLKPVPLSSNIKDLAMETIRGEMHRTICVSLGVDELLLSSSGAADRTPVDAALYHLYTTTIIPRWSYYEEVLNAELIPEYPDLVEQGAYFVFDQKKVKPLQDDQNAWAASLALLVEKGIIKAEVAAVELGYKLEDVPEAKAPTPAPAPIVIASPKEPVVMPTAVDEQANQEPNQAAGNITKELDQWQRKVTRILKTGGDPSFEFETKVIDLVTRDRIQTELIYCRTEDDVKELFKDAKLGTLKDERPSGMSALARSLDRATNLLIETAEIKS